MEGIARDAGAAIELGAGCLPVERHAEGAAVQGLLFAQARSVEAGHAQVERTGLEAAAVADALHRFFARRIRRRAALPGAVHLLVHAVGKQHQLARLTESPLERQLGLRPHILRAVPTWAP